MADVVAVAVGVAPSGGEAVGEASKPLGNAVNVASDALLQRVQVCSLTSADGGGGVPLLGVVELNLRSISFLGTLYQNILGGWGIVL